MSWVVRRGEFKEASVRSSGTLSSIVLVSDKHDISWTGGEGQGFDSITTISGDKGGGFAAVPAIVQSEVVGIPGPGWTVGRTELDTETFREPVGGILSLLVPTLAAVQGLGIPLSGEEEFIMAVLIAEISLARSNTLDESCLITWAISGPPATATEGQVCALHGGGGAQQ